MAGEMFTLACTPIGKAIKEDNLDTFKKLINDGENPLLRDRKNNTYLHYIATMYSPKVFHRLVSTQIDVNCQNKHGNTALHVSGLHGECGHVMDLMMSGVDPFLVNGMRLRADQVDRVSHLWKTLQAFYMPGLFNAIKNKDEKKIDYLLKNWCRTDVKKDGLTARLYAASLSYHHLVALIDRYQTSLSFIYGLLEDRRDQIARALTRFNCDLNFSRFTNTRTHPLQLAFEKGNLEYITWLCCKAHPDMKVANVNSLIYIQGLYKGPLFFESITLSRHVSCPKLHSQIITRILASNPDVSLRDERGRTFPHFCLDWACLSTQNSSHPVTALIPSFLLELVQKSFELGSKLSDRDGIRGLTTRNLAEILNLGDIVYVIDRKIVELLRESNTLALTHLALDGYEDFFFTLNHRDTWIYAAANNTNDATNFLIWFEETHEHMTCLQAFIASSDNYNDTSIFQETLQMVTYPDSVAAHFNTPAWASWKDKGGRCLLHLAILYEREDIFAILTEREDFILAQLGVVDNYSRTPLHYAYSLEVINSDSKFSAQLLLHDSLDDIKNIYDAKWKRAIDYNNTSGSFLFEERRSRPGLEKVLQSIRLYKQILSLIQIDTVDEINLTLKERAKQMKHLLKSSHRTVASIQNNLLPTSIPRCPEREDLGIICIQRKRWSFLRILITFGIDVHRNISSILPSENTEKRDEPFSIIDRIKHENRFDIIDFSNRISSAKAKNHT